METSWSVLVRVSFWQPSWRGNSLSCQSGQRRHVRRAALISADTNRRAGNYNLAGPRVRVEDAVALVQRSVRKPSDLENETCMDEINCRSRMGHRNKEPLSPYHTGRICQGNLIRSFFSTAFRRSSRLSWSERSWTIHSSSRNEASLPARPSTALESAPTACFVARRRVSSRTISYSISSNCAGVIRIR